MRSQLERFTLRWAIDGATGPAIRAKPESVM